MKITIVTAAYNAQQTIESTINSVLSQSYQNVEFIIVDGGSGDSTLSIIDRYCGKLARVVSEPDRGVYDAMNKGIALATGDVIGLLNADDIYANNSIIEAVAKSMKDRSIDCCYGDLVYVKKTDTDKIVRYWKSCHYRDGLFEKGWVPPHPTFFVRRTVYERWGGFDLSFSMAADFELMVRFLARHNIRSLYLPQLMVRMRLGGMTNKSLGNIIRQNMEILKALKKNGRRVPILFPLYKLLEKTGQFFKQR